jgi:hypothetical protein
MQLFDLAVLPWPPAETGLRFGLGPTFVFPSLNFYVAGEWMACHQDAPISSRWSVDFGVTIGFGKGE